MPITTTPARTEAPATRAMPKGLEEHLAEYAMEKIEEGLQERHVRYVCDHVRKAAKRNAWATIHDATEDNIRLYLHELTGHHGEKATPKYKNNVRGYLSAFFGWCVKRKKLDASPVEGVPKFKDERGYQVRAFTPEELDTLVGWVGENRRGGAEAADVYFFTAWTGLRREEVASVRECDVHITDAGSYLELQPYQTKSGKLERVPLVNAKLIGMLAERKKRLPSGAKLFAVVPHPNVVERDIQRCGLQKRNALGQRLVFHSLRHSLGTFLARAGVDAKTIQVILRHRDIRITMERYVDPTQMNTADALGRAEKIFDPFAEIPAQGIERKGSIGYITDNAGVDPMTIVRQAAGQMGSDESVEVRVTGSSPVAPTLTHSATLRPQTPQNQAHPQVLADADPFTGAGSGGAVRRSPEGGAGALGQDGLLGNVHSLSQLEDDAVADLLDAAARLLRARSARGGRR